MKIIDIDYDLIEVVKATKNEVESFMESFEKNLKSWLYGRYEFRYSMFTEKGGNRFVFGNEAKAITIPYSEAKILRFVNKMVELSIRFRLESPNGELAEIKLPNNHQSNHHDSGFLFLNPNGKVDSRNNFEITIFPNSSSSPYFWNFLTYIDGQLTIRFSKVAKLQKAVRTAICGTDFQSVEEADKWLAGLPKNTVIEFFRNDHSPSSPENCSVDLFDSEYEDEPQEIKFLTTSHPNHVVGSDTIWIVTMEDCK